MALYIGPDFRETIIDDETALWACRMCIGEGGLRCSRDKASAMLWALMNRWMLHPGRRNWMTYLELMRAFSQPINPRWQEGGDLAKKHAGTESCTKARLKRRKWVSEFPLEDVPDEIIMAVSDFSKGRLPPPKIVLLLEKPRISNWASLEGLQKKYPWGIALESAKNPDWFFEDKNLTKGSVSVRIYYHEFK